MKPRTSGITLQDIANQCGVSKATVSKVFGNRPHRVSPGTCARIREAAQKMGYNPALHENARRLALRKYGIDTLNRLVGIIYPGDAFHIRYHSDTFQAIIDVLAKSDFSFCAGHFSVPAPLQVKLPFYHLIARGDMDGIIATGGLPFLHDIVQDIRAHPGFAHFPVISIAMIDDDIPSISADVETGAYRSARHLLDLGHRHLLHFYYTGDAAIINPSERLNGVRRAMRERGVDPDVYLHLLPFYHFWDNPLEVGQHLQDRTHFANMTASEHLMGYIQAHPEVTAILALNDAYAMNCWYVLNREGIRVPDDMSLVGFDDTDPLRDETGENILTTIRQPLTEIGQRAAELMLKAIADPSYPLTSVTLPTELVIRSSTAPAPKR